MMDFDPESVAMDSISSAERQEACPGSAVIMDHVLRSGVAAETGTEIHTYLAEVIEKRTDQKRALKVIQDPKVRSRCKKIDLSKVVGNIISNLRMEVSYAIDIDADIPRELGRHLGRKYPETSPNEVKGTDDLEGINSDGLPEVADVKSGMEVTEAPRNLQLGFFAAVKMLETGSDEVDGRIIYITKDGDVRNDAHRFNATEMFGVLERLRGIRNGLIAAYQKYHNTGHIAVSPGKWCRFCPAADACPSRALAIRNMSGTMDDIRNRWSLMGEAEKAAAYLKLEEIERLVKGMKDIMRETIAATGLDFDDGRKIRVIEFDVMRLRNEAAAKLLLDKGVTPEEMVSLIRTMDRDDVLELLRKRGATDDEITSVTSIARRQRVQKIGFDRGLTSDETEEEDEETEAA